MKIEVAGQVNGPGLFRSPVLEVRDGESALDVAVKHIKDTLPVMLHEGQRLFSLSFSIHYLDPSNEAPGRPGVMMGDLHG